MKPPKSIGFEIKMLSNLIKRKLDDGSLDDGENGLTGMQGWIIAYLRANGNRAVFQRDIEKDFNIRRATVTGVLQLMERNGLLLREPVEHDARLKKLTLTSKADKLHERAVQRFEEFENHLRRGLNEEDLAMFFEIAERLKNNLE
ncbi:MarR family winged helix-turn-helix transcriptional regulator [Paenibacillus sinopodophylli]|uniref:MarR family winged helix-turn-helix transcriptional regulator n=1 Tax=Paenibacillus sinopodophylli TaxID=1837342 RepID=UPI00110D0CF4|nr:MarR family transcriptional regulator [Paenibacillus sinopodophylli]